jgi:hypothetical protein
MGGFSGNVTLAVTSSSSNLESILDTQNVVVTGHGYATANLSVFSLATGSYNVTVTGSRDQLQEVLPLMVNITSLDFDMTISPSNLTITVGQDNSAVLTFTSIGGFSDNINITSSSSPSGPRILVPTQVTLSPGAVIPVNVTVSAGSSAIGKYAINIQGASDDLKHAIKVILNISSNPNQIYYYGGVAAALALGAVVLGLGWPRLKGWIPSMLHTFSRNIRYP